MSALLESMTTPGFQVAADENLVAFWAAYGRAKGCAFESGAGAIWYHTGVPYRLFNGAVAVAAEPAFIGVAHAKLEALIAQRGAPALWWIGPDSAPARVGAQLEALGLSDAGSAPGMALDLNLLEDAAAPPGFRVEVVDSVAKHAQWARTAAIGTGMSEHAARIMVDLELSLGGEILREQPRYLGLLNGEPAASSALVCEAGVAGIYAVATLPHARGKGCGRSMTARPLMDARAHGYRVGVLQASSMGYPIYKSMGFRDVCSYALYAQG